MNILTSTRLAPVCLVLAACGAHKLPEEAAASAPVVHQGALATVPATSPLRQALQIAVVAEQQVERPIAVPGVVEADPSRLVKIVPPVAGRIEALHKQLGDAVKAGDALFTLDSPDLAQAWSDAAKAEAALSLAQRNLDRQRVLTQAEIAAQKDLEQAESDQAQALSEAQRARLRLAQLGNVKALGGGRHYTLTSPIAGHVIDMSAAQGGFWNDTNAPLMTVADLSTVWLSASVQEKDLAAVFIGQTARITLNAYPGDAVTGTVRYIAEVLDADTRTVKVRVAMANPTGRFRPGMFANVVFSGTAHSAAVVPATALVQSGFDTRVYVEQAAWVFQPRVVQTGSPLGSQVEIVTGLKAGERIVANNAVLLGD